MSTSKTHRDVEAAPTKSPAILMLSTIGDTTWRMFIPAVGLPLLGLSLDRWIGSSPWLLLVGIALGAAVAAVLVQRQLTRINK